jgi:hypothetical protein
MNETFAEDMYVHQISIHCDGFVIQKTNFQFLFQNKHLDIHLVCSPF